MRFLVAALTLLAAPSTAGAPEPTDRVRFVVSASEVDGGVNRRLYEAAIEGPQGTDFDLLLRGSRFRMTAEFLTDRVGPDELRVRATLEARRFFGTSERGLPLWEEDRREHDLRLLLDEDLVLLPFGGPDDEPRLEIRIRPALLPDDGSRKLDIDIAQRSVDNSVSVQARWRPHRYRARAVLLVDGVPAARSAAECLLREPTRLALGPNAAAGRGGAILLDLNVTGFLRGRPDDLVEIRFDLTGADGQVLAREWAGVGRIGAPLTYELPVPSGAASEGRHVLQIEVEPIEPTDAR